MICPYCKKEINPKLIKNHMERCPKKPVKTTAKISTKTTTKTSTKKAKK